MSLSVVIPTLEEERDVGVAVASVREEADEVLVVDGGSDGTRRRAAEAGARVLDSPRGRGVQLHRGAREARGDWLVFLHADTRLESGWRAAIEGVEAPVVGGAFRFALDTTRPARLYSEWAARLRSRILGLAFGDQAIFCRRSAYERTRRLPPEPLMERPGPSARCGGSGRRASPFARTAARGDGARRPPCHDAQEQCAGAGVAGVRRRSSLASIPALRRPASRGGSLVE